MAEDPVSTQFGEALIVLLLRAGLICVDDVHQLADEYDLVAGRNKPNGSVLARVAHLLRCATMKTDPPPAVDPAVEYFADWQRRQMVERTALYERRAREAEGGKQVDPSE